MAAAFELSSSIWLPAPIDDVFAFFARAENLERLTPPFLNFRIRSSVPIAMREGTTIDYRIRLRGIPLTWRSEITVWDPPLRFVDEQRRGPYRSWVHTHAFHPEDGGTDVRDRVRYRVWGGAPINRLLVAPDLRRIFRYRQDVLQSIFGRSPRATDVRIARAA